MVEQQIDIATADGKMSTFICHPERGGPYPVVLFFMDAPGIREELRDMARRLAAPGYYVMLPNMYYREGVEEIGSFVGPDAQAVREKMFALMASLDIPMVMADADALLAHAAEDPAASKGPAGAIGYCMSGRYALSAAARHPDRIKAAASLYGVRLVTDQPDSPHKTCAALTGELYVAWAETDHYAPLEELPPLREAFEAAGLNAEVELYKGAEHGFAFPQRAAYNRDAAERHWERLFALFGRNLTR